MIVVAAQLSLPLDVAPSFEPMAYFSEDRVYRYWLVRRWDSRKPFLGVVMLNPSTADEDTDDATIRWLEQFARLRGYGGIEVCNLYALRSRDPKALWVHPDPVGPDNDEHLYRLAHERDVILLAWGANARQPRATDVTRLVVQACQERGAALGVLGWTKAGQPRHPLYMPANSALNLLTFDSTGDPIFDDPRWGELMTTAVAA